MAPKYKIRQNDTVVVTAGKHKGRTGKVLRVLKEKGRVLVENVNVVQRHVKPRGGQPGGIVRKELPVHISNVALWDANNQRARKVGWRVIEEGDKSRKVRFDKRTQEAID
jgi:large subunit ribosomal protein L24